jgi:hypothetical protein
LVVIDDVRDFLDEGIGKILLDLLDSLSSSLDECLEATLDLVKVGFELVPSWTLAADLLALEWLAHWKCVWGSSRVGEDTLGWCDNPMLNNKTNRLAPSQGVLANSTTAPDTLPVCKPLQGQEVCCEGPAWDELKANFDKIKGRFKTFVQRRRERIEKIEKDLSDTLVEEVSDIINDNQAMVRTDAFKMEYQKLQASGKKTKSGKSITISPIQKKKFDGKGTEVCRGRYAK